MSTCRTIHYKDMAEVVQYTSSNIPENSGEFVTLTYNNKFWGSITEQRLQREHYFISRIKTELNDNFAIAINDDQLENSVNMCFNLEGYTGVRFKKNNVELGLTTRKQHSVYIPDNAYNILIKKTMDNIHFAIDRNYYLNLLGQNECNLAPMRNKIEQKDLMYGGESDVTPAMMKVIHEILNNSLEGSLGALMNEAKVMELIALHLDSVMARKSKNQKVTRQDRDLFTSIRDHLDMTFMEDHSLKGLGKTFGVNECKLKSGFKTNFHKTIFEYIHDLRMDHAYHLLKEEGQFVNEVSSKVGYKNSNHFSTAFKKKFGVTPGKI